MNKRLPDFTIVTSHIGERFKVVGYNEEGTKIKLRRFNGQGCVGNVIVWKVTTFEKFFTVPYTRSIVTIKSTSKRLDTVF